MRGILIALIVLAGTAQAGNWTESIKLSGDFRYRHEYVDQQGKEERSRHQIRMRLNVEGAVNDYVRLVTQLSTGLDNPTAANQTLTDGFSSKSVAWNLMYAELTHARLPGATITAGKGPKPWFRPGNYELIWDDDLNPEGLAGIYQKKFSRLSLRAVSAALWIEERSSGLDSYLGGGQAVVTYASPCEKAFFAAEIAYYTYVNVRGYPTFYDEARSYGNSTYADSTYFVDFELVEFGAQIDFNASWLPLQFAANFVLNTTADSLDNGWLLGFKAGQISEPGTFLFSYNYRELKRDAVVGVFTDNVSGGGGTNVKGHELNLTVQVAKRTSLKLNYFNDKINLANPSDYQRVQLDLSLRI